MSKPSPSPRKMMASVKGLGGDMRRWHELLPKASLPEGTARCCSPLRIPWISSMEMVLRRAKSTAVLSHQKILVKYLSQ